MLWLATSNDPTDLADNLLNRPGRFDWIFVFPNPAYEERLRLVARYSPWPTREETLVHVAARSDGLTGAHLKEVCYAAALEAAEAPAEYAAALLRQLDRVAGQHEDAREYEVVLRKKVGFG